MNNGAVQAGPSNSNAKSIGAIELDSHGDPILPMTTNYDLNQLKSVIRSYITCSYRELLIL